MWPTTLRYSRVSPCGLPLGQRATGTTTDHRIGLSFRILGGSLTVFFVGSILLTVLICDTDNVVIYAGIAQNMMVMAQIWCFRTTVSPPWSSLDRPP
jgi:hypothetical protein